MRHRMGVGAGDEGTTEGAAGAQSFPSRWGGPRFVRGCRLGWSMPDGLGGRSRIRHDGRLRCCTLAPTSGATIVLGVAVIGAAFRGRAIAGSGLGVGTSSAFEAAEVAGVRLSAIAGLADEEGEAADRAAGLARWPEVRSQGPPSATCGRFLDACESVGDGRRARVHVTGGLELVLQAPLLPPHELRGGEPDVEKRAAVGGGWRILVAGYSGSHALRGA